MPEKYTIDTNFVSNLNKISKNCVISERLYNEIKRSGDLPQIANQCKRIKVEGDNHFFDIGKEDIIATARRGVLTHNEQKELNTRLNPEFNIEKEKILESSYDFIKQKLNLEKSFSDRMNSWKGDSSILETARQEDSFLITSDKVLLEHCRNKHDRNKCVKAFEPFLP